MIQTTTKTAIAPVNNANPSNLFFNLNYHKKTHIFYNFVGIFFYSETKKMVLPSASSILLNGNNSGQVFNNPYKKAETDQIASLEKHVKMV